MINSVVGTGVSGGLTTSGRLSQKQNWAPKKVTHTIELKSVEISQFEQRGVVPTDERHRRSPLKPAI